MQRGALELRAVEVHAAQVRAGEVAIEDGASKLRVVEVYHCRGGSRPKLRPVRRAIPGLTWDFTEFAGWRSGYFKVSGIAAPRRLKACRWVLVGSVSIGTVTWVPVYRTWLRVRVARCSSRPRKLR